MPGFIPDLTQILAFALAGIVLAITPGPDMALFISRTINHGRAHGIAAIFGAGLGILVHAALAAFGLSLLLAASPTAFFILKICGALYLLLLAIQAVRSGGGLMMASKISGKGARLTSSFLYGLGSNITNPKVILFFVTFLPQFVSRTDPDAAGQLVFFGLEFLFIGVPINIACVYGAQWIARTLAESKIVGRLLNYSFAAVFAGFAATILLVEGRR